ncbi:hypothetical protein BDR07DRAFT_1617539 [Suillus spraguei]|nr:hypothetical protein BDR07DRAFT_1617539 [Suillus spraguei]
MTEVECLEPRGLFVGLPTLRDRSLRWLINGYLVKQCKAGAAFNLSFESLTSREALHALRDADKEVSEPPFPHAADVELDPSDEVSVDTVLQHIALGESSVPHGYSADKLGDLLVDNESEL